MAKTYAERISDLTDALSQGTDPEAPELARNLVDQVIIHPCTDTDPHGIEFIGNLIDFLAAAGLNAQATLKCRYEPDPVLALFVSSVKAGSRDRAFGLSSSRRQQLPQRPRKISHPERLGQEPDVRRLQVPTQGGIRIA